MSIYGRHAIDEVILPLGSLDAWTIVNELQGGNAEFTEIMFIRNTSFAYHRDIALEPVNVMDFNGTNKSNTSAQQQTFIP